MSLVVNQQRALSSAQRISDGRKLDQSVTLSAAKGLHAGVEMLHSHSMTRLKFLCSRCSLAAKHLDAPAQRCFSCRGRRRSLRLLNNLSAGVQILCFAVLKTTTVGVFVFSPANRSSPSPAHLPGRRNSPATGSHPDSPGCDTDGWRYGWRRAHSGAQWAPSGAPHRRSAAP